MRLTGIVAVVSITAMGAGQAYADNALAMSKNCMTCHALVTQVVGPSYKEIAAKYKDDGAAAGKLAAKIKGGGSGVWGQIAMPPNDVTDDEAARLVTWILAQK